MPYERLSAYLIQAKGRPVHFLPPYRATHQIKLQQLLSVPIEQQTKKASVELIQAVVKQRSVKSAVEIAEMEKAVNVTGQMHTTAMRMAKAGMKEAELAGAVEGIAVSSGGNLAYPVIMTVNGQTLHNHYHGNTLQNCLLYTSPSPRDS